MIAKITVFCENTDKLIRYETQLQRSIEKNLRLLRSLQGIGQMKTPERLEKVVEVLKRYFDVERICKLTRGTSGDRGRTFATCSKKV